MDGNFDWLRQDLRELREGQTKVLQQSSAFHERLDAHAKALTEHATDIDELKASNNELKGIAKGVKWLWAIIAGMLAIFGIHIGVGK